VRPTPSARPVPADPERGRWAPSKASRVVEPLWPDPIGSAGAVGSIDPATLVVALSPAANRGAPGGGAAEGCAASFGPAGALGPAKAVDASDATGAGPGALGLAKAVGASDAAGAGALRSRRGSAARPIRSLSSRATCRLTRPASASSARSSRRMCTPPGFGSQLCTAHAVDLAHRGKHRRDVELIRKLRRRLFVVPQPARDAAEFRTVQIGRRQRCDLASHIVEHVEVIESVELAGVSEWNVGLGWHPMWQRRLVDQRKPVPVVPVEFGHAGRVDRGGGRRDWLVAAPRIVQIGRHFAALIGGGRIRRGRKDRRTHRDRWRADVSDIRARRFGGRRARTDDLRPLALMTRRTSRSDARRNGRTGSIRRRAATVHAGCGFREEADKFEVSAGGSSARGGLAVCRKIGGTSSAAPESPDCGPASSTAAGSSIRPDS